jgi:lipopolysaccharide biosynthesis glycosyltransferase
LLKIKVYFDDHYLEPFENMIYSATLYKKKSTVINLEVGLWGKQAMNLSATSRNRIEKICSALEVSQKFLTLEEFEENSFDTLGKIIPLDANLARLDFCLNSKEDFLHLDVDLIMQPGWDELLNLFNLEEGSAISAVPNNDAWGNVSERTDSNHPQHWVTKVKNDSNFYFNAGVFIFHHRTWNSENLSELLKSTLADVASGKIQTQFGDQDILNFVTNGFKNSLPSKYNLQVNENVGESAINSFFIPNTELQPRILHYAGPSKPWKFETEHMAAINRVNDYNSKQGYVDTLMNFFTPYFFIQNQRRIWAHNSL